LRALAAYRSLLTNRPLTKLLGGEFVSAIGDWLYIVAILVVIFRETNDATLLGLFGALRQIPYVVLSIPAGIVADRFDRRLILLVTDLLRGGCMLAMAWLIATDGPVLWIIVFSILAACGSTFFYPAIGAYLPSLVTDERQLGPANSAYSSLDNLGFVVGPALGGVLVAAGGVTLAFVINAASFLVIAAILWTLPSSVGGRVPAAEPLATEGAATSDPRAVSPGPSGAPIAVPATIRSIARPLTGIGLIHVLGYGLTGGIPVLTVIFATDILHAGEAATGWLNAAIGIGGVTGALVSGALVLRRRLAPALVAGLVAIGAGVAVLGASGVVLAAMVGIACAAGGNLILEVVTTTIYQRVTPDAIRGRGLGILMTASTLAECVGAIALPVVVTSFGPWPAFGVIAAAMAALGILSVGLIGAAATRPESPFEAILSRVARLPLFIGVRSSSLERTLPKLIEVPVVAGEMVVRQGEPADRFYIIVRGTFAVSQLIDAGAEVELRRLGPDDVFGELGLLRGGARTATVTAASEGLLLALDRADFLALVGRAESLRGRLLGLYEAPSAS
jgi:MFS family permease